MTKVHEPNNKPKAKKAKPETISLVQTSGGVYEDKPIRGRPPAVTPDWQEYICEQLRAGRSLLEMTTQDKPLGIPSYAAIQATLMRDPVFQDNYARARSEQQEALAEQTIAIAKGIGEYANMDANERRLLIDTIKWSAGKLRAKVYGERVELTGKDGGAIQLEQTQKVDFSTLPVEDRLALEDKLKLLIQATENAKENAESE